MSSSSPMDCRKDEHMREFFLPGVGYSPPRLLIALSVRQFRYEVVGVSAVIGGS
jgi:hypothetical protein